MVSTGVILGSLFVLALFGLGIFQSMHQENLPRSSLAGAVAAERTQDEINGCMKDCMRKCVTVEGTEPHCLEDCSEKCDAN